MAQLYGPPPNISVPESLHLIFTHYCSPWKSETGEEMNEVSMDGASFARMCRETPDLDQFIGRTEIDLIFSKTKPQGVRRLDFDHFLDTLVALATRIYPEEEPTIALSNFLVRFIYALFDQPPSDEGVQIVDRVMEELTS
eukprot:gene34831-42182_t